MKKLWKAGLLGLIAVGLCGVATQAKTSVEPVKAGAVQPDLNRGFSDVAQRAIPAVVFVSVEKEVSFGLPKDSPYADQLGPLGEELLRRFFGMGQGQPMVPDKFMQSGQGSGFIISEDGFILTNNHVVNDADRITVKLHDGRELKATVVGSDPLTEVAVIKIDDDETFPYLPLGDSEALNIGEWVVAVGNPFGLSETLTVGVVSAKGRSHVGIADYEDFIQTDAAINPGNSGGPLLNIRGEVIGINTAIASSSGGNMGIGFAVPIEMASAIKDQLVQHGKVRRGHIGIYIQDVNADMAGEFGLDEPTGIIIADVMDDSAGAKAGLKPYDIILAMNSDPVDDTAQFRNEVAMQSPGTVLELKVLRDGKEQEVKVHLGELDGGPVASTTKPTTDSDLLDQLGMTVEELTSDVADRLNLEVAEGVLVARVEQGSPAYRADIKAGSVITDVNRQPVRTVAELEAALKGDPDQELFLFSIKDGQYSRFAAVRIEG